jgi:hypothetical protein
MNWLITETPETENVPIFTPSEILFIIQHDLDLNYSDTLSRKLADSTLNHSTKLNIAKYIFCNLFYDYYLTGNETILIELEKGNCDFGSVFQMGFCLFLELKNVTPKNIRVAKLLYHIYLVKQISKYFISYVIKNIDELCTSSEESILYISPIVFQIFHMNPCDIRNCTSLSYQTYKEFIRNKFIPYLEYASRTHQYYIYFFIWEGMLSNWLDKESSEKIFEYCGIRDKFNMIQQHCFHNTNATTCEKYDDEIPGMPTISTLQMKIIFHFIHNDDTRAHTCEFIEWDMPLERSVTFEELERKIRNRIALY